MYEENRIIRDARVLQEHFIPRLIVHRDGELKALRDCLKPVTHKQKPRNTFLYGAPGTGKTCIAKYVLEELSAYSGSVVKSYVNCWLYPSRFKILYNILNDLGEVLKVHRKGTPTDELVDVLWRRIKNNFCIIILDEVDQIEDEKILYDLTRMENMGLILISNNENAFYNMDERIVSSLASAERLEFPKYRTRELVDILKQRCEWGLFPGVIKNAQLENISDFAAGDARIAIDTLRIAAEDAENKDMEKVTDEIIEKALPNIQNRFEQRVSGLDEHQKILYGIIKGGKEVKPEDLYNNYEKLCKEKGLEPLIDRSVRKSLEKMARYNLIKTENEGRWRVYKSGDSK